MCEPGIYYVQTMSRHSLYLFHRFAAQLTFLSTTSDRFGFTHCCMATSLEYMAIACPCHISIHIHTFIYTLHHPLRYGHHCHYDHYGTTTISPTGCGHCRTPGGGDVPASSRDLDPQGLGIQRHRKKPFEPACMVHAWVCGKKGSSTSIGKL